MDSSRRISRTPDPQNTSLLSVLPYKAELEDVCASLGLSVSELYPETSTSLSDYPRLLHNLHVLHSQELRKAKIELVRSEVHKRQALRRPASVLRPKPTVSVVDLWTKRLNYAKDRAQTTLRVRENQHQLRELKKQSSEKLVKIALEKEQKRVVNKEEMTTKRLTKAEMQQFRRSTVLQRSRKARESPDFLPIPTYSSPKNPHFTPISPRIPSPPPPIDLNSTQDQLITIESRLEKGAERAVAFKQAKSMSVRLKREGEHERVRRKNEEEGKKEWEKQTKLIEKFAKSKEIAKNAKIRENKGRIEKKVAENQVIEEKIREKDKKVENRIRELRNFREIQRNSKSAVQKSKLEAMDLVRKLQSIANFSRKEEILGHLRESEAQVKAIEEVKRKMEAVRLEEGRYRRSPMALH